MNNNDTPSYYDLIHSEEFKIWFGDWEKAYAEAGLDFKHKAWKDVSKAVNDLGQPLKLYHGTTHDWTVYSRKLGNHENDMGIGFYTTSDMSDAQKNYLSEGVDLKTRIDVTAEHIKESKGTTMGQAKKIAEKKFKGNTEKVLEVFIKVKKPLIIDTKRNYEATYFDFAVQYDEESEEYTDSKDLIKFKKAFDDVCEDFDIANGQSTIWSQFMEQFDEMDYISAYHIILKLKRVDYLYEYTSNNELGGNSAYEFISQIFQKMGFDGVIYVDASEHFKGMNLGGGTKHIVAFKPKQIKLADGTNIDFSSKNPDIRFDEGGGVEVKDEILDFKSESDMYNKYVELRKGIDFDDEADLTK